MKTLLTIIVASLVFGCTTPSIEKETVQTATLTGTYTLIIEPFRCSLPSTSEVSITTQGATFAVSYTNSYTKKATIISGITADKTTDGFVLKLDGKDFGKYVNDSYMGLSGNKEQGMVLFLQNQLSQTEYLEFMGKK